MITLPTLYPHQEDLRDRTRTALSKHRRVILCANTGVGKTRTAKWILGATANRQPNDNQSGRSLFCVHRRGLVENAVDSFSEEPRVPHGVIMSGKDTAYGARIQIASIDTLISWFIEDDKYRSDITFDLIAWDEAHSHHPKFAKFLERHDAQREAMGLHEAYVIGLTATPQAQGLADVYKEIVLGPSAEWLIEHKYLSPYRYVRATQGQLEKLKKRGGEFTSDSHAQAMDGLAGDLVRDWKQFAEGRPTVGFFPRRSHAQDALTQLTQAGLRAAYVDGETPDEARRNIYWRLNNGQLDYLANVQVVERGTDIPAIACVQLCVAVGSITRYRQMIGRGSRVADGKTDCLVLDHGGNVARHGFFEDDPEWTLDITQRTPGEVAARPTIECPNCQAIYRGGKCRSCGYEPTARERKSQGLTFDGSQLQEITRERKQDKPTKTPSELMVKALYAAGRSRKTWRQCCGIYFRLNEEQGTRHRIPRTVDVGGHRYTMVTYGDRDGGRWVADLYPFTVATGDHRGDYLVTPETGGNPY